ncbi:MAG: sporulation protein YqfD [Clostridia bacterium]|nr:sporulation protein YqfD [Clostridia bacterium]
MFWFVVGYARVELEGEDVLNCINIISGSEIDLKNINKMSNTYYADVKKSDIKQLYDICNEHGIKIRIIGRFGLAMKLYIYKKRTAFLIGLFLCMVMFFVKLSFINKIEIIGNNYLTDDQIKQIVEECGIYYGRFVYGIDENKIQKEILKNCKHFSWVWVEIKGNSVFVDVREKISQPKFYDKSYACNIIAERDGVISEAISESGINYTKVGDYVRKGDLLIGGIYDSNDYAPVRFVRASGSIKAKTVYTISDNYDTCYIKYTPVDKKLYSYKFKFFGFSFSVGANKEENIFLMKQDNKNFSVFGKKISSLGFTKEKYCEIIRTECIMDKYETEQMAIRELTQRLYSQIPDDAVVIDEKNSIFQNPDGSVCATVTFECIEDIGCEARIELIQ